jgi:D-alanyl-D-alanine carboxypeptidase
MQKTWLITGAVLLVVLGSVSIVRHVENNGERNKPSSQLSIGSATSLWVIVNKLRPLNPINYTPPDLVTPSVPLRLGSKSTEMSMQREAAHALEAMFTAASKNGVQLNLQSGYRSYTEQVGLYNYYVKTQGQTAADEQSARAGYSEHQTGLTADIGTISGQCEVQQCFANTTEGEWVAANSYKYGFIIRYPQGKQAITGYEYEPWHLRYVGVTLATTLHSTGQTLEEHFNLPPAPDYR